MRRARRAGFTLIELLAVVGLLGVILFVVIPNLDNVSPRTRLKAAARKIGSTMELAQGEAIATGKEFLLAYDFDKRSYWIVLPPKEPETHPVSKDPNPNEPPPPLPDVEHGPPPPVDPSTGGTASGAARPPGSPPVPKPPASYADRETLGEDVLPDDVELQSVSLQTSGRDITSGVVYVPFSSLGNEGSHAVLLRLKGSGGALNGEPPIAVRFNALTRTVDFANEKLSWDVLRGN